VSTKKTFGYVGKVGDKVKVDHMNFKEVEAEISRVDPIQFCPFRRKMVRTVRYEPSMSYLSGFVTTVIIRW
jgi:flagellar biosynthesis/type III secretory pathway M-ring protein FliF/YscJ